jgi:hypothetical protein
MAESNPCLSLRAAIPTLRRLLSPWSWATQDERVRYAAALHAIEAATREGRDLPLPSAPGGPSAVGLPIPSSRGGQDADPTD